MYVLITKCGDVISKKEASSIEEAIEIFSVIKGLDMISLLDIYEVRGIS